MKVTITPMRTKLTMEIPQDLYEKYRSMAAERGCSLFWLFLVALVKYAEDSAGSK